MKNCLINFGKLKNIFCFSIRQNIWSEVGCRCRMLWRLILWSIERNWSFQYKQIVEKWKILAIKWNWIQLIECPAMKRATGYSILNQIWIWFILNTGGWRLAIDWIHKIYFIINSLQFIIVLEALIPCRKCFNQQW